MRVIMFRAKAINRDPGREYITKYKNGDWVYGLVSDLDCYKDNLAIMTNEQGISNIDVSKSTIGQFTGHKDNNGKDIYEGDIVEFETEINCHRDEDIKPFWKDVVIRDCAIGNGKYYRRKDQAIVEWNEKEGMWDLKVYNNNKYKRKSKLFTYRESGYLVIGNIHDNPELVG